AGFAIEKLDPETAEEIEKTWEELSDLARENGYDLSKVPVVVYDTREELTSVLGFRHIKGPDRWYPLAKARFVNEIVERMGKNADFGVIARRVGSKGPTIRNNYSAYRVYVQARDEFDVDTSKLDDSFGVWYTALNNVNIREHIGYWIYSWICQHCCCDIRLAPNRKIGRNSCSSRRKSSTSKIKKVGIGLSCYWWRRANNYI
ncbi:MAG: hypothetical protein ACFFDT_17990, partial [Candidatus Hodarchaeota archaeon]